MSQEQVICDRCNEPITERKNLLVAESNKELIPFHYRCFIEEKRDTNTKLSKLSQDILTIPSVENHRFVFVLFLILSVISTAALVLTIIEPFIRTWQNIVIFAVLDILCIIRVIDYYQVPVYKKLREESIEKYDSKLPE